MLFVAVNSELQNSAREVYALLYKVFDLVRPMQPVPKLLKHTLLPLTKRPFSKFLATSDSTEACYYKVQLRKLQCIFKHRPSIHNVELRTQHTGQLINHSCSLLGIAAADSHRMLKALDSASLRSNELLSTSQLCLQYCS
jgi:hypothetical protein